MGGDHLVPIIMHLLRLADETAMGISVASERRRQAKRFFLRGRKFLRSGMREEADVQFGVAFALDCGIVRKLIKREREELVSELGKLPDDNSLDRLRELRKSCELLESPQRNTYPVKF